LAKRLQRRRQLASVVATSVFRNAPYYNAKNDGYDDRRYYHHADYNDDSLIVYSTPTTTHNSAIIH